jgi:8-oxo-dGTP pyrophosphatase MutT (NUDIX family)
MSHHIPSKFPRAQALCVFYNMGRILVYEANDSVKNETFYRPLGGGIHFQEKGTDAVKREIMEELGEETENVNCIGTLENIYMYEGEPGHEIVFVFDGKLKNKELYNKDRIKTLEGPKSGWAIWKNMDEIINNRLILYPDGLTELLQKHFK